MTATTETIRTKLTPEEHDELAKHARANEQTISQLVRLILRSWLREARDTEVSA